MNLQALLEQLRSVHGSTEVVLRDLNGLDWKLEPDLVFEDDGILVFDTQNINRVDPAD